MPKMPAGTKNHKIIPFQSHCDFKTVLKQYIAPGGGVAISIKEATDAEMKGLKKIVKIATNESVT